MLEEVIELLSPREGEVYADATAGLGGHASEIATHLGSSGTIVINDLDEAHLRAAEDRIRSLCQARRVGCPRIVPIHGSFAALPTQLREQGLAIDMLLADLGFASDQVDDAQRGFSFSRDGPLDMRYDRTAGVAASTMVNELSESELATVLYEFGEERASRRIARRIVQERESAPIETTAQLAAIVRRAIGAKPSRIDPATRTFQALRIAVNDELGSLRSLLGSIKASSSPAGSSGSWLADGARIAIIAFHSLEDRQIKHAFRDLCDRGLGEALCRGACKASEEEIAGNRRSRSARLRAIRLSDPAPPMTLPPVRV